MNSVHALLDSRRHLIANRLSTLLPNLGIRPLSCLACGDLLKLTELLYQELPQAWKLEVDLLALTFYLYGQQQHFDLAIAPEVLHWCAFQWREGGRLQ